MKDLSFLKNKKVAVCSILAFIAFICILFSSSYAFFSKRFAVSDVNLKVGELNYSLTSSHLKDSSIVVNANSSVIFEITVKSLNEITSKYELYYNLDQDENVVVGYLTSTKDSIQGEIGVDETKVVTVKIINESARNVVVSFGVEGGLINNNLTLSKGKSLVELENALLRDEVFQSENLGNSCKTYNDGVDTFLVGECQNNYVWYSGKLWRIVLKNNTTGAIKMITDNAITTITYNPSNRIDFENSYVDQWLSQEFLPTLHDYQDYLVENSTWDITPNNDLTPTRPNKIALINRTVGLLNSYEYYTTYAQKNLATSGTGYLNTGIRWWLITSDGSSNIFHINHEGALDRYLPIKSIGVRPSVNLRSEIQILEGKGTTDSPYRLVGDKQELEAGVTLLSTRYSGEYVEFNHELYRIVKVENGKAKIVAVESSSKFLTNQFHTVANAPNFANSNIKSELDVYYSQIDSFYREMIITKANWYLGKVGNEVGYKGSICASPQKDINTDDCEKTDAVAISNIGLPRFGEMFTSQITKGTKLGFWTLTPYSSTEIRNVNLYGVSNNNATTNTGTTRISMYLKPTVRIANTNTGDGTYERPYQLELSN